ncbi:hypothetical protein I5M27_07735 [Adhaeribacter sp. BT258]|uniref:Uncharacterized protein n=1 Tax=Adhaeribacter terrigena TaxID=2793070 RepID=A0ABS1C2K2_9BACT|nr:hypothetical protein [Adhaeribacter terrigena]MBK0402873.1 hypothetical protein [Adhaeribacter terrigena]
MTLRNKCGLISLLVGLPFGLAALFISLYFLAIVTGGGLPLMGTLAVYLDSIIGLFLVFPIMLWISGNIMVHDILDKKTKWNIALKYSTIINSIIWLVFLIIFLYRNYHSGHLLSGFIFILVLSLISILGTLLTYSLIVYFLVKKRIHINT